MHTDTETVKTEQAAMSGNGDGKRLDMQALVSASAVRRKYPRLKPLEMAVLHAVADYPLANRKDIAKLCSCCVQTVSKIRNAKWFEDALLTLAFDRDPLFTAKSLALKHLALELIGRRWTKAALEDKECDPTANELKFLKACSALSRLRR